MTQQLSHSAEDTMRIAADLARTLKGGELIALRGELGAGKTCFVRGLARGMGIDPAVVSSPTFVIMHEYESTQDLRPRVLVHIDAYRLRGGDELESIGWDELIEKRDAVIALEWPERVAGVLPFDHLDVTLEHRGQDERLVRIQPRGDAASGGTRTRPCPICQMQVAPDVETFPFCSKRCRLADLSRWMGGAYRVSRPATDPRDLEENTD